MTSDDDWVAELAGDGGISLDPGEQADNNQASSGDRVLIAQIPVSGR